MGKLNMGILGGFSGTVGTVIGSTNRKGDDIIRAKTKRTRTSTTEGQVNQRTKFGMVTQFMKPLNPLLKFGCRFIAGDLMTPYNYACKIALNGAIIGIAPDFELDYSKVLISVGPLSQSTSSTAGVVAGIANFNWIDNSGSSTSGSADNVVMVVYNANNKQLSYSIGQVTKAAETGSLPIPNGAIGDELLFFLFFQSAIDPFMVSTSQFLGTAIVTE